MTPPPASAELLAVVRAARALLATSTANSSATHRGSEYEEREALRIALEALDRIP